MEQELPRKKLITYLAWIISFFIIIAVQKYFAVFFSENVNILLYCIFELFFLIYVFVNRKDFKEDKNTSLQAKIIICSILFLLLAVRVFFVIRLKYFTHTIINNYSILERIKWLLIFTGVGFTEEILFKSILYKKIIRPLLPVSIAVLICALVFALWHIRFYIFSIVATMIFQLITLPMYEKYPNIFVYSVFHALLNFSFYL